MRSITLRDLEDLGWKRFEDLVAVVVFDEHPTAEQLSSPDGGADVLLERGGAGVKAWQAKHYPRKIHWKDCIKSLDSVVKNYDAREVVFVYPRNMGSQVKKSFREHLRDRHPGVEVSYISGAQLIDKLRRRGDDVVTEFFGPDPRDQASQFARQLAAEGLQVTKQPEADPLTQRFQLADEAGRRDRYFRTEITLRTGETPMSEWAEEPMLLVSASESDRELRIAAWPEKKMEDALSLWFEDSEEGRRARWEVGEMLARDGKATLPKGAGVRLNKVPEAIKAVSDAPPEVLTDVDVRAEGSSRVRLSGTHEGEQIERTMELVSVPSTEEPPEGFEAMEFGCMDGELALFLRTIWREGELQMSVDLEFVLLDPTRREGIVDALRLLVALDEGGQMEFLGSSVPAFPVGPTISDERLENNRLGLRFFSSLRIVEDALGVDDLPLGEVVTQKENDAAATAAHLIESKTGEFTFTEFTGEMPVEEVEALEREGFERVTVRFPVRTELLGRELYFGVGEAELPLPEMIEISDAEDPSKRRLSLEWPDKPSVAFELITGPDEEPETYLWASGRTPPRPQ